MWPGGNEPKPATNQNHLRMYSHNLCPFVCRARYTFAAKDVPFQEVMVDMNDKAQWHKDFNGGMVPVLEAPNGTMIPESAIAMQYALDSAPANQGVNLIPEDPLRAAEMRVAMQNFDKNVLSFLF